MAISFLASAADELDITALLPSLDNLLSKLVPLLRILVLAGPLALLGLGLYYFFAPPKEANYSAGYRFRYAMSRVGVWRFTQWLAGLVYSGLGLVLTVVMAIVCIFFGKMAAPDMLWAAAKCVLWELGVIVAGTLAINITVIVCYDSEGNRRKDFRGFKE